MKTSAVKVSVLLLMFKEISNAMEISSCCSILCPQTESILIHFLFWKENKNPYLFCYISPPPFLISLHFKPFRYYSLHFSSWNSLYNKVWNKVTMVQNCVLCLSVCVILCVSVCKCVCVCVNEIKWEWMRGPPRGLAARAVYNHQATSFLLSCPPTLFFLPLLIYFHYISLWLQSDWSLL